MIPPPLLILRADATPSIGSGHVLRCLALAQAWEDDGGEAVFVGHFSGEALAQRLAKEGFDVHASPPHLLGFADIAPILKELASGRDTWITLDGYNFSLDYQEEAARIAPVLLIDDYVHQSVYHADALLNSSIGAENFGYDLRPGAIGLFGPKYAPIRREFRLAAQADAEVASQARRVLLSFGGSDPSGLTIRAVEALSLLPGDDWQFVVAIGPNHSDPEGLTSSLERFAPRFECRRLGVEMPQLMAWADIAVSAAGSTSWELACLGVASILVVTVPNQEIIFHGLLAAGAAEGLTYTGPSFEVEIRELVLSLASDSRRRMRLINRARTLCDGQGAVRVVRALRGRRP
ncbi:MAG: UDP-2,4-diacetamido-2,4,6-trideoxy-beta-L-altropyranose hydrolase [Desulfovibrio sp.]|nr:UDP-2,4-diacetamido-2,4,6-trideoxy-beta-L-altropyranose hydrolase [Desulfovibrio sp.]MBI4959111.1 UDP-2,4-diacetamido-2,4,6-trideoxy-beta-L-altropyranose hydrolase [Desulfovibrio sp.]